MLPKDRAIRDEKETKKVLQRYQRAPVLRITGVPVLAPSRNGYTAKKDGLAAYSKLDISDMSPIERDLFYANNRRATSLYST
jgi:hypothetical protein